MSEKIKRKNTHLIGMDLNQLEDFSEEFGQSRFRGRQLLSLIHI